jgi:hypothetical protein
MSDSSSKAGMSHDRRRFLKMGAGAIAAVPVAALVGGRVAFAEDLPKLDEADPSAVALGYKHDAADVDTAKFPKRTGAEGEKQLCSNCNLYQGGDAEWGPCAIFPGRRVAGPGWCNAWIPMQG